MDKKVVGILGSFKKDGNVAIMLQELLKSAEESGNNVKQVSLCDLNIEYCRACMYCRQNGRCIINDDLDSLAKEIVNADVVVLAAPTYWANVPAVVKNLFDRMAGYVMRSEKKGFPKPKCSKSQQYILLTACSTPFPLNIVLGQSTGSLRAMTEFFKLSGMSRKASVVLPGTLGMKERPDKVLGKVKEIGKSI
jgi:FMN-dependent NADH-azoreductase